MVGHFHPYRIAVFPAEIFGREGSPCWTSIGIPKKQPFLPRESCYRVFHVPVEDFSGDGRKYDMPVRPLLYALHLDAGGPGALKREAFTIAVPVLYVDKIAFARTTADLSFERKDILDDRVLDEAEGDFLFLDGEARPTG
jgi:hypothetical protein